MNEILIVPDVHGRRFWEPALDYPGQIIFLGDYCDPFQEEGILPDDAYLNFLRIVEFAEQNPDRVTLLIGNHELHYFNHEYRCTRFSALHYTALLKILTGKTTRYLFTVCKQVGKYLFSHAGVHKDWYNRHQERFAPLGATLEEQINQYFRVNPDAFAEGSTLRGGDAPSGSPLWGDIRELDAEEEHFDKNIVQIVGHTQTEDEKVLVINSIALADNQRLHILRNGEFDLYR